MASDVLEVVDQMIATEQISSAASGLRFVQMLVRERVPYEDIATALTQLRARFPEPIIHTPAQVARPSVFGREIAGI